MYFHASLAGRIADWTAIGRRRQRSSLIYSPLPTSLLLGRTEQATEFSRSKKELHLLAAYLLDRNYLRNTLALNDMNYAAQLISPPRRPEVKLSTSYTMLRKKIAIVGSGCAGLGAAWASKDSDYEIHLFEQEPRLGGHTNTQRFSKGDLAVPVDTGFIVMNTATYPNFISFLKQVGVETVRTAMTFGISRDHGKFEWSGESQGLFAQRRNFCRLRHWRMIFDIVRFNEYAVELLDDDQYAEVTIGEYLRRHGYSKAFCDDYLIPMTAAVWSTSPDKASLEFPAQTLIRFLWNHHLLSTIASRPDWLTIPGGSQRYIDAIVDALGDRLKIHLSSSVVGIGRPLEGSKGSVRLSWVRPKREVSKGHFDTSVYGAGEYHHVILACHGDQILPMLSARPPLLFDPGNEKQSEKDNADKSYSYTTSAEEQNIFTSFQTSQNICYLHADLSLMPSRRQTWSSWNYLINTDPVPNQPAGVSLTYNMNILQHIPTRTYGDVMVTMNPDHPPKPELTQGTYMYRHPLYTTKAIRAQRRLPRIQGHRGVSFCGAWTKYGFHEDGFSSGLKVAIEQLGAKLPFQFVDSTKIRGDRPELGMRDYVVRMLLSVCLIGIRLIEMMLRFPGVSLFIGIVSLVLEWVFDKLEKAGITN